jgi:hypothetical protein
VADEIKFLSQITPSSNNLGAGDKLVGVSGATDLLFTPVQVAAGLPGGGGGGVPGGSPTQVQFNSSGAFGGDVGFTYGGNGKAALGSVGSGTGGALSLKGNTSGTVALAAAPAAGAWTMQLPTTPGSPGFVLNTDGSGHTSWVAVGAGNLTFATADVTYHVTATGNDTTGDGSVGAPFATIQNAFAVGTRTFNFGGFNFTIQVGPGTFQGLNVNTTLINCNAFALIGDNSVAVGTPSPVILTTNPQINGACTITTGKGTSGVTQTVWVSGFTFTGNANGAIDASVTVFLGEPSNSQPSKNYYKPSLAIGGAVRTILLNAIMDFSGAISTFDVSLFNSFEAFFTTIGQETIYNSRLFLDNWQIVGGTLTVGKGFIWHGSGTQFEVDATVGIAGTVIGPKCQVEANSFLTVQGLNLLPGTLLSVVIRGGILNDFVNTQTITGSNPAAGSAYTIYGPSVNIGQQGVNTGQLKLLGTTSGQVTLSTQDAAGTWTLKFPTTTGTVNQVLQTDGTGVTSWVTPTGGGGGTPGGSTLQVQYNNAGAFGGVNLFVESANVLGQRNGVNAQSKYVYNTFTDASNYERAAIDWTTTANVLSIGTQAAGTGTVRNLKFVVGGANQLDYGITNLATWTTPASFACTSLNCTGLNAGGGNIVSTGAAFIGLIGNGFLQAAATNVLRFCDSGLGTNGWLNWAGQTRVTSDFSVTSSATLINVTGLSVAVAAGRTYSFDVYLSCTCAAAGGAKAAIAGTCTATNIIYDGWMFDTNVMKGQANSVALGGTVASSTTTATTGVVIQIKGTITVNAAGTLTVQIAQNTSNATATIAKRGSYFIVHDMP